MRSVITATFRPLDPWEVSPSGHQGLSGRVCRIKKFLASPGFEPRTVQLIASRCTGPHLPRVVDTDCQPYIVSKHLTRVCDQTVCFVYRTALFLDLSTFEVGSTAFYRRVGNRSPSDAASSSFGATNLRFGLLFHPFLCIAILYFYYSQIRSDIKLLPSQPLSTNPPDCSWSAQWLGYAQPLVLRSSYRRNL
jgi:hypothetical protein